MKANAKSKSIWARTAAVFGLLCRHALSMGLLAMLVSLFITESSPFACALNILIIALLLLAWVDFISSMPCKKEVNKDTKQINRD